MTRRISCSVPSAARSRGRTPKKPTKIVALSEHADALETAATETEKSLGRLAETRRAIDEPRR